MRTHVSLLLRAALVLVTSLGGGMRLAAQQAGTPAPRDTLFDFLVGEWRVEASPRVSMLAAMVHGAPRYTGTWRGRRTDTGVSDEVRVTDAAGTTRMVLRFERTYDHAAKRWRVREFDREGASSGPVQPVVTADAITLPAATPVARSRFVERTPTRFRYLREVSTDGGRTWGEPVYVVTATRTLRPSLPAR